MISHTYSKVVREKAQGQRYLPVQVSDDESEHDHVDDFVDQMLENEEIDVFDSDEMQEEAADTCESRKRLTRKKNLRSDVVFWPFEKILSET